MKNIKLLLAKCNQSQFRHHYLPTIGAIKYGPEYLSNIINSIIKPLDTIRIDDNQFNKVIGYTLLYENHYRIIHNNELPITIGGDHSITHSTIYSSLKKYKEDLLVISLDKNCNINICDKFSNRNKHEICIKNGLESYFNDDIPKLNPNQLVYYGVNDSKINSFLKLTKIMSYLETVLTKNIRIHISFNVAVLNTNFLDPTYSNSSDNKLHPNDIIILINYINRKFKITSLDIIGFNILTGDIDLSTTTIKYILSNILK
jgi:arginase family enzyme